MLRLRGLHFKCLRDFVILWLFEINPKSNILIIINHLTHAYKPNKKSFIKFDYDIPQPDYLKGYLI